jgi:hypothetical protein
MYTKIDWYASRWNNNFDLAGAWSDFYWCNFLISFYYFFGMKVSGDLWFVMQAAVVWYGIVVLIAWFMIWLFICTLIDSVDKFLIELGGFQNSDSNFPPKKSLPSNQLSIEIQPSINYPIHVPHNKQRKIVNCSTSNWKSMQK